MQRFNIILLFLCFCQVAEAEALLKGRITYQNTGASVKSIQVLARGASPTITKTESDASGIFRLVFPDHSPGDTVILDISTRIYELVNHTRELVVVLPSDPDSYFIRLVVCKKGERDRNAVKYYEISTSYLTQSYESAKKRLNQKIGQLNDSLSLAKSDIGDLQDQISSLQQEYQQLEQYYETQLDKAWMLAEEFALTDLAQADSLYNKAFNLFTEGQLQEARQLLDGDQRKKHLKDIYKKEQQIKEEEGKLNELKVAIQEQEERLKLETESLLEVKKQEAESSLLAARFAKLELDYTAAFRHTKEAMRLDSSQIDIIETLGDLYAENNQQDLAADCFHRAMDIAHTLDDSARLLIKLGIQSWHDNRHKDAEAYLMEAMYILSNPSLAQLPNYQSDRALARNILGFVFADFGNRPEAEASFQQAILIWENLSTIVPGRYDYYLGNAYEHLGAFYDQQNEYPKAEKAYNAALKFQKKLLQGDNGDKAALSGLYNNMGILYTHMQEYTHAAIYLDSARQILKTLANLAPTVYELGFAKAQHNLGDVYRHLNEDQLAYNLLLSADSLYKDRVIIDPDRYEPLLASTSNSLANIYADYEYYGQAIATYKIADSLYQKKSTLPDGLYRRERATILYNLGSAYLSTRQLELAKESLETALHEFYWIEANGGAVAKEIAATHHVMGKANLYQADYIKAKMYFDTALIWYDTLRSISPVFSKEESAKVYLDLGPMHAGIGQMDEAEKAFLKALEYYEWLHQQSPVSYAPVLAYCQTDLGFFYFSNDKPDQALPYLQQSAATFRRLAKESPESFEMELCRTLLIQGAVLANNNQSKANERLLEAKRIAARYPDAPFSATVNQIFGQYFRE